MRKISSMHRYQTEKAIIDALLKISEIIKKTTRADRHSKRTQGDGDRKQPGGEDDYAEIHGGSVSRPTRTFESYVSGFNQQSLLSSLQRPSNCNRAPTIVWNSRPHNKRYYSTSKRPIMKGDYRDYAYQRYCYDIAASENDHRKKSLQHHGKRRLSGSNKSRRHKCQCQTSFDDYEYSASDR